MADTWRVTSSGVTYASAKSMLDVYNGTLSSAVVRVYRIYWFNGGGAVVTGVLTNLRVNRTITATAGTTLTPIAHDTNNATLNANTTAGTNRTITRTSLFRQILYGNDEPVISQGTMDEWELLIPFAEVWSSGYATGGTIEPLVCRATQGVELQQPGANAVGSGDGEIEFTNT